MQGLLAYIAGHSWPFQSSEPEVEEVTEEGYPVEGYPASDDPIQPRFLGYYANSLCITASLWDYHFQQTLDLLVNILDRTIHLVMVNA